MLMQCPDLFEGGTVVEQVVANIDVAPTVMEAMGLEKPPHMDGQSFLPLGMGRDVPCATTSCTSTGRKNFPHTPTQFALRGDRFKYITYYGLWDTDELYDLQADPGETRNLLHDPEHSGTARFSTSPCTEMRSSCGPPRAWASIASR